MAIPKRTLARFNAIAERQSRPRFGPDYRPAIRATPAEAPSRSRCSIIRSPRWNRREIHLLSAQELKACLLALYHPDLFDLHEQRILYPYQRPHPLRDLQIANDVQFPDFRGTVDVCRRLGFSRQHPKIFLESENAYVPFPYVGDLLLFLNRDRPRVINWTIKLNRSDFRDGGGLLGASNSAADDHNRELALRHQIESAYYLDAGILTRQIAGNDIPNQLFFNLRYLFDSLLTDIPIAPADRKDATALLQDGIQSRSSAHLVLAHVKQRFRLTHVQTSAWARQEIWYQRARVDLFEPIDFGKRLRPEGSDPLQVFAFLFEE